jgi:copper chaperone CopZ
MLAPMAYGMSGGMLGGILGGWFAGLRDEHNGPPAHENSVMVASMALMSGMMGAMPAAMVAGMMAVMGPACLWATVATGLALAALSLALVLRGRYRIGWTRAAGAPEVQADLRADGLREVHAAVQGMTCNACACRVREALLGLEDVREVEVSPATGGVRLLVGPRFAGTESLARALDAVGYPLE